MHYNGIISHIAASRHHGPQQQNILVLCIIKGRMSKKEWKERNMSE